MFHSTSSGSHPGQPLGRRGPRSRPTKRRLDAPDQGDPVLGDWTITDVDAAFADYRDQAVYVERLSPFTVANLTGAYRNFRRYLLDGRTDATPLGAALVDVDGWMRWMAQRPRPLASHTVHTWWRNVRRFFLYLEATHRLPSPFLGRRAPTIGERIPKAKTPAECARILDAAYQYPWRNAFERARNVAMLGVVLYAGLRRGEVLRLQFLDVSFEEEVIWIRAGKGRGGGKDRVIMLAPDLRRLLETYLRERRKANLTSPEFFASLQTRRGVSEITLRRIVRAVRDAAGVRFSLHALRHSFVTQLLRSGVPIHTVASLAGHTKITTTEHYSAVWDEDKRLAVRTLSFRPRRGTPPPPRRRAR